MTKRDGGGTEAGRGRSQTRPAAPGAGRGAVPTSGGFSVRPEGTDLGRHARSVPGDRGSA